MFKKEFYEIAEAAALLSKISGDEMSTADVLRATEDGQLSICFQYRGLLGVFPEEARDQGTLGALTKSLFPMPLSVVAIDCYLRSEIGCVIGQEIIHPQFDVLTSAARSKRNMLRPFAVVPFKIFSCDPLMETLNMPPGSFWARLGEGPGWLGLFNEVPVEEWLFHLNDLRALLTDSKSAVQAAIPATSPKKHVWDDHNLRRLLDKSREIGMTQEKIAAEYGISRTMIGRMLTKAKDLYGQRKASAFGPLQPRRPKK